MIKIDRVYNEGEINRYKLDISPNIHNDLINFFNSQNVSKNELDKLDVIFEELDGEYIFIKGEYMRVHFFITKFYVDMVIDSKKSQLELNNSMRKIFIFPYERK